MFNVLEGTEGQAEFCQGGIGWHWFEPSISEDDDEPVPELWDGKEDDSGSEGESLCRRLQGHSGDTSSEGTSSEDDDEEAYTTEEVGWYEFDLWDVKVNIIKETFPPQPPQEGKFGKLIVPYGIFDSDSLDDRGSMPSRLGDQKMTTGIKPQLKTARKTKTVYQACLTLTKMTILPTGC